MSFKAEAGHHLAPKPLSSGRNVFEELGDGFSLLAFDATDESVEALRLAAVRNRVPLKVIRDTYAGEQRRTSAHGQSRVMPARMSASPKVVRQ